MYQSGTFILRFSSKEDAKSAWPVVKVLMESADEWNQRIMVCGSEITVGDECYISKDAYENLVTKICTSLAQTVDRDFLCYAEHLSDEGEIHESALYQDGVFYSYAAKERYASGSVQESSYQGIVRNRQLVLEEQDCSDSQMVEARCCQCGEYYSRSEYSPVSRCPFCGTLTAHTEPASAPVVDDDAPGWKSYEFEYPLGVSFPEIPISQGMDWLSDCEENETFGLQPACFRSKNQYDAALLLCKICGGWFGFDSQAERLERMDALRKVLASSPGEPMWYYDVWQRSFDWIAALREANPKYDGQFAEINSLWELFSRLQQRSCLDKAECFAWFVSFFGEDLRLDERHTLSEQYVQSYDNHMEMILFLCPEQISLLTEGVSAVTANGARHLSRAAAGLIRLGRRTEGMALYEKVFQIVWEGKSSADEKKAVMDEFLSRLAAGYENEPYLDAELSQRLEAQCKKYSDAKWTAKIRMMLGRNSAVK